MKLFSRRCVSANQVLDTRHDLTFKLDGREEFQRKNTANKANEYEYVQREFGYDSVPPSQHVPSHSIDTEDPSSQEPPTKQEPSSDISGSVSDAQYVAGSGRFPRYSEDRVAERRRRHTHDASPIPPRHSGTDIVRTKSRSSYQRDPISINEERPRDDDSSVAHTKPAYSAKQSKRDAQSADGKYRSRNRYTGPGSATEAHSTGAIEAIYRTSTSVADLRELDDNDKEYPVIDRVPTAFGYVSEESDIEDDSKVSRYSVDGPIQKKPTKTSLSKSGSRSSARVDRERLMRNMEQDDEDVCSQHEQSDEEKAEEDQTKQEGPRPRSKSIFSESTRSYDAEWRKESYGSRSRRHSDEEDDEDHIHPNHLLSKSRSRTSRDADDRSHPSIKPRRSKGDPPGFEDLGAASRVYSSRSTYRDVPSRHRGDRSIYEDRLRRESDYDDRDPFDDRDDLYVEREREYRRGLRDGRRSHDFYDDEVDDHEPHPRRFSGYGGDYHSRSYRRASREFERPSTRERSLERRSLERRSRFRQEEIDEEIVVKGKSKAAKETRPKKARGLFGRILGDKDKGGDDRKSKEMEVRKKRLPRDVLDNGLPTSIEEIDGLSVRSEISYDKSSMLKRKSGQRGRTQQSNPRERARSKSRSRTSSGAILDEYSSRRHYDEPASPDGSAEDSYAAPFLMKKSSSALPFESARSPAPALRFNPHSRRQVPVSKSMSKHLDAKKSGTFDQLRRTPSRAKSLNVTSKSKPRFTTGRTAAYYS